MTPGRIAALFFVLRSVSFTTGCGSGPADGEIGGKCKDGCRWHCNEGAVCDDSRDVCVASPYASTPPAASYVPPPPPTQTTCNFDVDDHCDGGLAFACAFGQEIPVPDLACTYVGPADGDMRRFCCSAAPDGGGGSLFADGAL